MPDACDAVRPRNAHGHYTTGRPPSVAAVVAYLKAHPALPSTPEFITRDMFRQMVYVRWPNGAIRWETIASMTARGFPPPSRTRLEHAQ